MEFQLEKFKRILDVGGGHNALELATDVIDWRLEDQLNGRHYYRLDVCTDKLPFADREIDFVYCRHALEDFHNPEFALREMRRVARCGYIETPHILTELRKGVQSEAWRGWMHHFWFVWSVGQTIKLLPKSTAINGFLKINDEELAKLEKSLLDKLGIANHFFMWENGFDYKVYKNGIDFDYTVDYSDLIMLALEESVKYRSIVKYTET